MFPRLTQQHWWGGPASTKQFLKRLLQLSPPKTIQFLFFTKKCTESPKAILHITHRNRRRNKPNIPVPPSKATRNCGDKIEPPKIVRSRDADGKMWLHPKVSSSIHTFPITPASCDSFTPQIRVTLPQRRWIVNVNRTILVQVAPSLHIWGEKQNPWGKKGRCKKHEHTDKLFGAGGDKERGRVGGRSDEPRQSRAHGYWI